MARPALKKKGTGNATCWYCGTRFVEDDVPIQVKHTAAMGGTKKVHYRCAHAAEFTRNDKSK